MGSSEEGYVLGLPGSLEKGLETVGAIFRSHSSFLLCVKTITE